PIEAAALGAVYGEGHEPRRPLLVGSIKANVGHLEGAAGIAGLVKATLCLWHESLVGTPNFRKPNHEIPIDDLGLKVITASVPWSRGERVRRAGVSSFGLSGTNAHVVLEEAPLE